MGHDQISKEEKDRIRGLLTEYYPKKWAGKVVTKLSENGHNVHRRAIYNFFYTTVAKHGKEIVAASLELIKEAQKKSAALSRTLDALEAVQNSDTQKLAS